MNRSDILDTAKTYVTRDRNATHGEPEDTFGLIADYWSAHLNIEVSASDVAVMMGLLKIARIRANPGNDDNWIDLCGYSACGGELATGGSMSDPTDHPSRQARRRKAREREEAKRARRTARHKHKQALKAAARDK